MIRNLYRKQRKLIFGCGLRNKEVKTMTEKCKKIIEEHKRSIENEYFLPVFLAALLKGGIELFDELRAFFEDAGIELTNEYF